MDRLNNFNPASGKFVSFDATSLFTNVPVQPTIDFLKRKLPSLNVSFPVSINCLIDLILLASRDSYFSFDGTFYQQIFGFAMGNPLSPVLANFFLEHVETDLLNSFSGSSPKLWVRYVDDVLAFVDSSFILDDFLNFLNALYPTLCFTHEWESNNSIAFLDVLILKCGSSLLFKVFRKSTHSNAYLHFFSFHPVSIKISVAQGLFLRAFRICSPQFLESEISFIKQSLSRIGYPPLILHKALLRARSSYYSSNPRRNFSLENKLIVPFVPFLNSNFNKRFLSSSNSGLIFTYPNTIKRSVVSNSNSSSSNVGIYKVKA